MQTVVGVLRGGPSREHEVSLASGAAIIANLPEHRFVVRDIYIDRQGTWHDRGRATTPDKVLRQVDIVLNGLHGEYGEDGGIQRLLEQFGIPYSGADALSAHFAMHKVLAKMRAKEAGFLTPDFRFAEQAEDAVRVAHDAVRSFHPPVVVKPVAWGSSVGIEIVSGYAPILAAIERNFADGAIGVVVEEYIRGREASAGVVEKLRGEALYALPVVEIIPASAEATAGAAASGYPFFSYDAKYSGKSREIVPGGFNRGVVEELQHIAREMHRRLGLRHYSRSDFIVSPKGVYYLETNALPGLSKESLLPKSLAAVGVTTPDFLTHLVNLALAR